ncbi:hypothetical protein BKA70DRAFT_1116968 [Coprinopsis sp. MPI-PUGE-AT-0042]|nr:hypothetical protein BKA70DRAFT_1116968 [Coprinopsis sp. MPI-PUGE-AT-0042]
MGFAGVGSYEHFCSFCSLHRRDIEELNPDLFRPRNGLDVRLAAEEWRLATTKVEHERLFKLNGVRHSPLNLLLYRDPVRHTLLGLMHNWIESVLQHHVQQRWGIGQSPKRDGRKA